MNFLAMLNLEHIAACMPGSGLPHQGLLLFFLDWVGFEWGEHGDEESCRVIHLNGDIASMREFAAPEGAESFATRELVPWRGLSLPDILCWRAAEADEQVEDWFDETGLPWQPSPAHQIGGWPFNMHSDVHVKCAKLDLAAKGMAADGMDDDDKRICEEAAKWRLLFQLDSDSNAKFIWADGCALHFMIREEDLRAGRFNRVLPSI